MSADRAPHSQRSLAAAQKLPKKHNDVGWAHADHFRDGLTLHSFAQPSVYVT